VVHVTYRPTGAAGTDSGDIQISSGAAVDGSVTVPLKAVSAGPALCPCIFDGTNCTAAQEVDFGFVDLGMVGQKTVRIQSCGTEPVDLTEAVLETAAGPFKTGPEFAIATPFMIGTLMPGTYAEGVLSYAPTMPGMQHGGLRYTQGGGLQAWLPLVGRAATCALLVEPSTVAFGGIAAGTSADRRVNLENNGSKDCMVSAISSPANGFSLVNLPPLPLTIAAGQSTLLTVRYTAPATATPALAQSSFTVSSNSPPPSDQQTVVLSAMGGGTPVCTLDVQPLGNMTIPIPGRDGELLFGSVNIGFTKTLSVRLRNDGNAPCSLQNYSLTTEDASQFAAQPPGILPASIPAGMEADLNVTFSPTHMHAGPLPFYNGFSNHIDFTAAGPGLTKAGAPCNPSCDWSIAINAAATTPSIDIIPGMIDFGVITWDNPQPPDNRSSCGSETRSVDIYNSGSGPLHITAARIDMTSDPVFEITAASYSAPPGLPPPFGPGNPAPVAVTMPPYAMTVDAGGSAQLLLRFFPTRINPALHSGLLVIENDATMVSTVPLQGTGTPNSAQIDTFAQLSTNKVDLLWVIDDSTSMLDKQQLLASNFSTFISYMDSQMVDYQIGVTTTEPTNPSAGKIWACNGFNKVITASDPNRNAAFQCAAQVLNPPNGNSPPNPGTSDGKEAGLEAAKLAVSPPIVNNENAGFVRPDARLVIIAISDDDDVSSGNVNDYIDFFRNVKGFGNSQLVSFNAIAGDVPNGCGTADPSPRYQQAASALNGQLYSLCAPSWSALLMSIGFNTLQLRSSWTLSRAADPNTLSVSVNGRVVAQDPNNGWTYDTASNTITFHGSSVPMPASTIDVHYSAVCVP
jgi:hypothetical protein